jgi:protein HIRA/HIR1
LHRDGEVSSSHISAGVIPFLERHTTNEVLLKGRAYHLQRLIKTLLSKEGFEGFESGVSIAHLENRVAAALQLGAKEEFRIYLFMYAKRLGAEGLKPKVEELLKSIVGGVLQGKKDGDQPEEGQGWLSEDDQLCGWDRKDLLKGVVLILGKIKFQSHGFKANHRQGNSEIFRDSQSNMRGLWIWSRMMIWVLELIGYFAWRLEHNHGGSKLAAEIPQEFWQRV